MTKIEDLKQQISVLTEQIKDKQDEIDNFEKELDEDTYDEMLNSIYGDIEVCGYKYPASMCLYNIDEIAYNVGMSDLADSMELEEFPAYNDLVEELETLQNELEDLENELEELESGENESEDNEND